MTDLPTPYPGLFRSEKFAPREQFSISQIEKAFGAGYECLDLDKSPGDLPDSVIDRGPGASGTGCLRSWGWRYLGGIKQPEYTWEEACALPEHTEPLRRLKGGAKAKTWGKVAEREIERFLTNDPSLQTTPLHPHVLVGLHLLPHPSEMSGYELQAPVRVRTHPIAVLDSHNAAEPIWSADSVTWQGFKDFVPTLPGGARYLIDFKTTKPIVNKKENVAAGRAPNAWAYMKDPDKLLLDWQFNLYEWDEYVTHGSLVPGRWVYFASPGTEQYPNKPEARASDMSAPDLEIVRGVVLALDARARVLRDYIRQSRQGLTAQDLPANTLACSAYGGCPYRSSVGGPCDAEQTQIIPIGKIVPRTRGVGAVAAQAPTNINLSPAFTFNPGDTQMTTLMDQIKQKMAEQAGAPGATQVTPAPGFAPGAPPPAAVPHAPGYPQSAAAHIGAPVPTAGLPPVFPAAAPTAAPPPAAPPRFNPAAFSFGGQAPQAPAPAAAPPPPPAAMAPPFGTQLPNPEYFADGAGGAYRVADIPAMLAAGHPDAVRLWGQPAAAPVAPSPTPGLPPEAFAPGGPVGAPAPRETPPVGAPAPAPVAQPEKRKRRTKAEMAADAAQADAEASQYPRGGLLADGVSADPKGAQHAPGFAPRDTDTTGLKCDPADRIALALESIADSLRALLGRMTGN